LPTRFGQEEDGGEGGTTTTTPARAHPFPRSITAAADAAACLAPWAVSVAAAALPHQRKAHARVCQGLSRLEFGTQGDNRALEIEELAAHANDCECLDRLSSRFQTGFGTDTRISKRPQGVLWRRTISSRLQNFHITDSCPIV
jgi:hypothetical protein